MKFTILLFFSFQILVFVSIDILVAQSNTTIQAPDPHPSIEINRWYLHEGDLTLKEVLADNPQIWKLKNLNSSNKESQGTKWFKHDVKIPDYLKGLDLILHIKVDPSAIVYLNGEEIFTTIENYGRGVLLPSAKAGEKYSLQVKVIDGDYSSRFYYAKIVGMPKGYAHFLSAFSIPHPKEGIAISDWKFQMGADNSASEIDFIDSEWKDRKSGKGWTGEMQHAWYRAEITLPKEINGFLVEGKPIRLIANTNDKGEIWVNGDLCQKFREGDGDVILSNSASVKSPYLIAIKAINEWGTGDVRSARIITDEAYNIRKAYNNLKVGLNRLNDYCEKHPDPDMSVINKVTEVVKKNRNSDLATMISQTGAEIKRVEAELAAHSAFSILPYLQNLKSDEITIMWETIFPTYGKVLYGEKGNLNLEVFEDEIPSNMHEITLEGLAPNKTYGYRVECNNISSNEQKFTTKNTEIAPFKFVVLGDTRSRHDIHSRIVKSIVEKDPLFVINTGDMVGDGRDISDWETFFKINRELMRNTPYYTVLGNHEKDSPYYYKFFDLPNNERYYSFNVGDALFVILDSEGENISDTSYVIGENSENFWQKNFGEYFATQKKWLEDVLEQNKEAGFIFVFQHKPLYSVMKSRVAEAERYRKIWGDVFDRYNIQVFMNGHDHHYHHAIKKRVHYITTAGGGAGLYQMDGPIPETIKLSKIEHFVLVSIKDNEAVLNVIDIDGNEIEEIIVERRK
jgi:Calcineurin-like phosphoesterase/Purple acid Phosphatase, N-terminal domain